MKVTERDRAIKVAALIAPEVEMRIGSDLLAGTLTKVAAVASHVIALSAVFMKTGEAAPALAQTVLSAFGEDLADKARSLIAYLTDGRGGRIDLLPGTRVDIAKDGVIAVGRVDGSGVMQPDAEACFVSKTKPKVVSISHKGDERCPPATIKRYTAAVVDRCMASPAACGYTAEALTKIMQNGVYVTTHMVRLRFPLSTPTAGQYDTIALDPQLMEHGHPHEILTTLDALVASAEQHAAKGIETQKKLTPFLATLNSMLIEAGLDSRVVFGWGRGERIPLELDGYGPSLMRERMPLCETVGGPVAQRSMITKLAEGYIPVQLRRQALCPALKAKSEENVDLSAWQVDGPMLAMIGTLGLDREGLLRALVMQGDGMIRPQTRARFGMGTVHRDAIFSAKDGRISCSMEIAPGINWNRGILVIRGMMIPATAIGSVKRQPLGNLVAHPLLPNDALILATTTTTTKKGETYTVTLRDYTRPAADIVLDRAA